LIQLLGVNTGVNLNLLKSKIQQPEDQMFGQPEPYLISFNAEDLYPHFDDDHDYDSQPLSTDATLPANDYDANNGTHLPRTMISPGSTIASTTWTATETWSPTSTGLSSLNDGSPGPSTPVTVAEQEVPSAIGNRSDEEEEVRSRLPTRRTISGPIHGELGFETSRQSLVDWPAVEEAAGVTIEAPTRSGSSFYGSWHYYWTNGTQHTMSNFTTQVEDLEPNKTQATAHRYFSLVPALRIPQEPTVLPFRYILLEPSTNQDSDLEQEPLSTHNVQPPDDEAPALENKHRSMEGAKEAEEEHDGPRKRRRPRKLAGDPVLEQKPVFTTRKDVKTRFHEATAIPVSYQRKKSVAKLEEKRNGRGKRKRTRKSDSGQDVSTPLDEVKSSHDAAPSLVRQSMNTVIRKVEEERDEQAMRSQRPIQTCERCREGQVSIS
jgi:hypothetical protein